MQTRDGVRLDADVYYPEGDGPFPVLLMRQPYGRAIASTIVYAPPQWYAAHGYIVVIQDVRGRGTSEGDFSLFATETEDGADTIKWVAALPKSSGAVGMYGFSYQGMTQLHAAIGLMRDTPTQSITDTPLKTLSPAMIGYDLYADWAYEGGAFCLQASWGWAVQLAAETARRQGDGDRYRQLYTASRSQPDYDPVSGRSPLLSTLAPDSFYHDWLDHPTPDDYWQQLSPCHHFQPVDLPILHIGGWFDLYLRGTLRLYHDIAQRSCYPQHLWVGPWPHLPWGRYVGDLDFGDRAISDIDRHQIRWFNHFLKDPANPLPDSPVQLFVMGTNEWRSVVRPGNPTHPTWPTATLITYHLHSTGLASTQITSGSLLQRTKNVEKNEERGTKNVEKNEERGTKNEELPHSPTPPLPHSPTPDILIHDPWRPIPALGGHASSPAGPKNQAALGDRTDILTYTTPLLTQVLQIAGDPTVEIECSADVPSFDLCVVLSDVYPNGQVYNFTQGYQRVMLSSTSVGSTDRIMVAIALQPTCIDLLPGHALRLGLSAACYPAYNLNPGTGTSPGQGQLLEAQVITIAVFHASRLHLPVIATHPPE
ncbi:MAG: CocE/NonD family hydrolase [Cyanothece sp. SIO2G6]|nr:CocE/NonD family hydrolase [Cyanothece sp. SIO2G6]